MCVSHRSFRPKLSSSDTHLFSTEHSQASAITHTPKATSKNKPVVFLLSSRYKNNVLVDAKAHSEKYTVESNYNMHSLEIKK